MSEEFKAVRKEIADSSAKLLDDITIRSRHSTLVTIGVATLITLPDKY
jgi:hypothetical protein